MVDYNGKEIKIGDMVYFASSRSSSIKSGVVIKIYQSTVRVAYFPVIYTDFTKMPTTPMHTVDSCPGVHFMQSISKYPNEIAISEDISFGSSAIIF